MEVPEQEKLLLPGRLSVYCRRIERRDITRGLHEIPQRHESLAAGAPLGLGGRQKPARRFRHAWLHLPTFFRVNAPTAVPNNKLSTLNLAAGRVNY